MLGQIFQLLPQLVQFGRTQSVGRSTGGRRMGLQLDTMIHITSRRQTRWQISRKHIRIRFEQRESEMLRMSLLWIWLIWSFLCLDCWSMLYVGEEELGTSLRRLIYFLSSEE